MELKAKLKEAVAYRPLQYTVLVLAVLGLLFWIGRRFGLRVGTKSSVKYPTGPDTATDAWTKSTGASITTKVYDALSGWSLSFNDKDAAMLSLLALSNAQLSWVAGEYAKRYNVTLLKAIESETIWGPTVARDEVVYRLKNLKTTA